MAARAVILNLTYYYEYLLLVWCKQSAILNFKPNFELCDLNNAAMLQYGDFGGNFKLMLTNLNI